MAKKNDKQQTLVNLNLRHRVQQEIEEVRSEKVFTHQPPSDKDIKELESLSNVPSMGGDLGVIARDLGIDITGVNQTGNNDQSSS